MVKACPTIALTFVNAARRTTTTLVAWNEYRYRSAEWADEHIRLDGIHAPQVIRSVDAALGRLKSLPRAIGLCAAAPILEDRKSTRLNSSHSSISYAVFCLKKKNKNKHNTETT